MTYVCRYWLLVGISTLTDVVDDVSLTPVFVLQFARQQHHQRVGRSNRRGGDARCAAGACASHQHGEHAADAHHAR